MLSDRNQPTSDDRFETISKAVSLLRAKGLAARYFADPKAWDSIAIEFDADAEYLFTPWFFEVKGCNFAAGKWIGDEQVDQDDRSVAFNNAQDLADIIADWMASPAF
jgi:hypothetical protein